LRIARSIPQSLNAAAVAVARCGWRAIVERFETQHQRGEILSCLIVQLAGDAIAFVLLRGDKALKQLRALLFRALALRNVG
jgi:hypothetical protein